jgi:hypothetical protein
MFAWYRNAAICYAYLEDVNEDGQATGVYNLQDPNFPAKFAESRWFGRGWTLQELLAPSLVVFYSANWVSIGTRDELKDMIAKVAAIDTKFFEYGRLEDYSIAQRMSWASGRKTTRIEDQAYCLLGLFGVNMPLLYGEGQRAFVRLQQEIMKESDDQSIFAWSPLPEGVHPVTGGLLASTPSQFASSGHIGRSQAAEFYPPYAITNRGVQISLLMFTAESGSYIQLIPPQNKTVTSAPSIILTMAPRGNLAVLNCQPLGDDESRIGIFLDRGRPTEPYRRANQGLVTIHLDEIMGKASPTDLLIQTHNHSTKSSPRLLGSTERRILIQPFPTLAADFTLSHTVPDMEWRRKPTGALSSVIREFWTPRLSHRNHVLEFRDSSGHAFLLVLEKKESEGAVTGIEAAIAENAEMALDEWRVEFQARNAVLSSRIRTVTGFTQRSSNGPLHMVPRIREAGHASLVSLEVRRGSTTQEGNASSSLKLPSITIS